MKLKEFEAKELLASVDIPVASSFLVRKPEEIKEISGPVVIKAQILAGGRGKAGGILFANTTDEAQRAAGKLLLSELLGEKVEEVLVARKLNIEKEYYLGIMFDTKLRQPVFIFSTEGGVDIEQTQKDSPEKVIIKPINILHGLSPELTSDLDENIVSILVKLYTVFCKQDLKMIEINPLVLSEGKLVAADAVAVVDDDANYRRDVKFVERTGTRKPTAREIAAHEIDKEDYRGVAGKTFIDLDGDIAFLTSGGGASMTLLDAVVSYGGKPANYTEYSGNPPSEKVERLTRITLDREGLTGCMVAGVIANFTHIYETLTGFVSALKELKPDYPILIRRAGPGDKEAYEMLKQVKEEFGLNLHIFDEHTPLTKAGEIMVSLSNKFKAGEDSRAPVEGEL